jgi:SAM-dependent methyltransferase
LIEYLPRIIPAPPDRPELAGPEHPIRKVTQEIAFAPGAWTRERATKLAQLFDTMAPDWNERISADRPHALRDGLTRGGVPGGRCLEVGSGTGSGTRDLLESFDCVVALDLALQMLRHAPQGVGHRIQGDAASLPLADASVDAVVLVNAFLFPDEVERVLAAKGCVLFVSSLGDATPIHLSADEVHRAMPGAWKGVAAEAGWGSWCALRRAS